MSVNPYLLQTKHASEDGEVNVLYALKLLTTEGYRVALGISLVRPLVFVLSIRSASMLKDIHKISTSKRGHVVYSAKGKRRLGIKNSGLPTRRNPHGNGSVIVRVFKQYGSTRMLHAEVRKLENLSKPKAHVGQGSLDKMLIYDDRGRCINAYNVLCKPEVLQTAYMRIKSEPGNMTTGSDKETLDGISEE